MADGNRYVRGATTEVNSGAAASLMKEKLEPKSQHLPFEGWALPLSLCFLNLRKKLCRSSLLPTLGHVGIHNHVLPPHSSERQENKNTNESLSITRNR